MVLLVLMLELMFAFLIFLLPFSSALHAFNALASILHRRSPTFLAVCCSTFIAFSPAILAFSTSKSHLIAAIAMKATYIVIHSNQTKK